MVLLDPDGIVCAEGCIKGFTSVHSCPIPAGQILVLLASVIEGKSVHVPCPSLFDAHKVEVGRFYAWPLSRLHPK